MAQSWYLRDDFLDNKSAGSVNGTAANPGPGTRYGIDTNNKLSLSGGYAILASGGAGNYGDPSIQFSVTVSRVAGRLGITKVYFPGASVSQFGLATTAYYSACIGLYINTGANMYASGSVLVGPGVSTNTPYYQAIALRANGYYLFFKGGTYTNWTLLYIFSTGSGGPYYFGGAPAISTGNLDIGFLRVPTTLWLPTPLASDGFSSWGTTDGKGHAEGVAGGIGAGGAGVTWTTQSGTIGVSGGVASASLLDVPTARAVATVPNSTINLLQFGNLTKGTTGCGIVLRFQDTSNYIYAWHDGTYCYLIKRVGGGETQVIKVAATYSAGAVCVVIASGTSFSLFYNNAAVGSVSTISDAALQTTGSSGIIFFDTNSTVGSFVDYAHGDENQYDVLNGIMGDQLFGEPQWSQLAPILAQ